MLRALSVLKHFALLLLLAGAAACTTADEPRSSYESSEEALLSSRPSARYGYTAVWDTANNREILFGGNYGAASTAYANDTWSLSIVGNTGYWVQLSPTGTLPTGRRYATAVWDAANSRMILFGGDYNDTPFNDVWTLTFSGMYSAAWAQLSPTGTPPAVRTAQNAVWDAANSRMIVFGGNNGSTNYNNVYTLSFASSPPAWSQVTASGTPPSVRTIAAAVWDAANTRLLVFGGTNPSTTLGDTFALSFASSTPAWTQLSSTTPIRAAMAGIWDAANGRMIVFGGFTSGIVRLNVVQAFDGTTWSTISPTGTLPTGRDGIRGAWDPTNSRMIIFGGGNGTYLSDTQVLSFATPTPSWTQLTIGTCEAAPATPVLTAPTNGSTSATCGQTFTWSSSTTTGVTYSLLVNGSTVASGLTGTSYTLPTTTALLPSGNTWQVVTSGCPGASATSTTATFAVTTVPTPTLVSPADGVSGVCGQSFSWSVPGGTSSSVRYDVKAGMSLPLTTLASNLSTTSYTASGASRLADGTYSWQVVAQDCATSATSVSRNLVVNNMPPTPALSSPADSAWVSPTPTFSWSAPGAASDVTYALNIDGSPFVSSLTGTSYTIPSVSKLSSGAHTWSVQATGCLGDQATSVTRSFSVDGIAPGVVTITSPTSGAWLNTAKPTVTWTAPSDVGAGVASYKVSTDSGTPVTVVAPTTSYTYSSSLSAGSHCVAVQAVDAASNTGSSAQVCFGIDLTAPSVPVLSSPAANALVVTAAPTLSWLASTDSASGVCGYIPTLDGNALSQQSGTSLATTGLAEGSHSWTVVAVDCAGNQSASATPRTFTVDLTAPSVVSLLQPAANGYSNTASPTFSWTAATDSGSNICGYILTVDGSDVGTSTTTSLRVTSLTLADGPHTWTARAKDCAGNVGAAAPAASFVVDTVAPTAVTITSPEEGSYTASVRPRLGWTASTDSGSGISSYNVALDQSAFSVSGSVVSTQPSQDLADGQHCFTVTAVDRASNVGSLSSLRCFNVDLTPPSVPDSLTPTTGNHLGDALGPFSWAASTDTGAGVCGYIPTLDGSDLDQQPGTSFQAPSALSEGSHSWTVRAVDCVGNQSATAPVQTVVVDLTGPTTPTILAPKGGVFVGTGSPQLSWTAASDPASGVCSYVVTVDGAETSVTTTIAVPSSPLADGEHTWTVRAVDCAGNLSAAATPAKFSVDTTAPGAVSITAPPEDGWVGTSQPQIAWTAAADSGSGIGSYRVSVDSGSATTVSASTRTFTSPPLSESQHCVTVQAVDAVGNAGAPASRCFRLDFTPPTTPGSLAPSSDTRVLATPTLSWLASRDTGSGVCGYIPTVDGSDLTMTTTTSMPMTSLSSGQHVWTVRAVDCVGNVSAMATEATFIVDVTASGVSLVSPIGGVFVSTARPTLLWSAASDAAGVCDYYVTVNGSTYALGGTETSWTPQFSLSDGSQSWTVQAVDCLGNVSEPAPSGFFSVDTTGPGAVAILTPHDGSWINSATPTIQWRAASDDGSGVSSYVIAIDAAAEVAVDAPATSIVVGAPVSEGRHCVSVAALDTAGNRGATATSCFGVDLTSPLIDPSALAGQAPAGLPSLAGAAWASHPVLSWPYWIDRGGSGICSYQVTFDGTPYPAQMETSLVLPTPPTEGRWQWRILVTDCAGNQGSGDVTLTLDATPPTVPEPIAPVGDIFISNPLPSLQWTDSTDALSGLKSYIVSLDGTDLSPVTSATVSLTTPLADGSHTWAVRALDNAGNDSGASAQATFNVDTSGPGPVTFTSPTPSGWVGTAKPTVTWTPATDSGAGVASYLVSVDRGTTISTSELAFAPSVALSEGDHCVEVSAVDAIGNIGGRSSICFRIDLTAPIAPTLTAPAPGAFTTSVVSMTWRVASDSGSGVCGYVVTMDGVELPVQAETVLTRQGLSEGSHSWAVQAVDCVGNRSAPAAPRSFTVDLSPPSSVVLIEPGLQAWTNLTLPTFTWQAASDPAGLCGYTMTVDGMPIPVRASVTSWSPESVLDEGLHTWNVTATDCVGNVSEPASPSGQFGVDLTAPSDVTFIAPEPGSWISDNLPTIAWSPAQDSGAGIAAYIIDSEAGESQQDASLTTLIPSQQLQDGSHCFEVRALDGAGNVSAGVSDCFLVDHTPPTVPSPVRPGAQFVDTGLPSFAWGASTDSGSGVCGYAVTIDAMPAVVTESTSIQSPLLLDEGRHSWTVAAVDCVGNRSAASVPVFFSVDLTQPSDVSVSAPTEGAWVNVARPQMEWLPATDQGSGVAGYVVSVDGSGPLHLSGNQTAYTVEVELAEGLHCLSIYAIDGVEHAGPAATRCFSVDLTPPLPALPQGPMDGACLGSSLPTFSWSAGSDALSGVAGYTVNLDLAPMLPRLDASQNEMAVTVALQEGAHTWSVDTTDVAGTMASSGTVHFAIDTSPPDCVIRQLVSVTGGVQIQGIASGTGCASVADVAVLVNDEPAGLAAALDSDGRWTATWTSPPNGMNRLACTVTDQLGRRFTSTPVSVSVGPCFDPSVCDVATSSCSTVRQGSCDDGNGCTENDMCQTDGTCAGQPSQEAQCVPADAGDGSVADGGTAGKLSTGGCSCGSQGGPGAVLPFLFFLPFLSRRRSRSTGVSSRAY